MEIWLSYSVMILWMLLWLHASREVGRVRAQCDAAMRLADQWQEVAGKFEKTTNDWMALYRQSQQDVARLQAERPEPGGRGGQVDGEASELQSIGTHDSAGTA